eukprot:jgi/Phyca11/132227/e_gw1.143.14.1
MSTTDTNTATTTTKWTAKQKPDSKRAVLPPTSDDYSEWTVDQLKLECTARKLSVAKNTKKEDRVSILNAYDQSKGGVALLLERQRLGKRTKSCSETNEARRTKHCVFRLINVLFSDEFFDKFVSSGNQLTRKELDEGGRNFWESVAAAFNTANETYDRLVSDDSLFDGISPDQITVHSAAKLKSMWKDVHAAFSQAEANSKISGEHAEFWDFCRGDKAVMYLNLWCDLRGSGREFCSACVYEENEDDSTKEGESNTTPIKINRKRQKTDDSMSTLTDIIKTLVDVETNSKNEKAAVSRLQRERLEMTAKTDKLTTIEGILSRHRHTLEEIDRRIHQRNVQGMPTAPLRSEKERIEARIKSLQDKASKLEDQILDS